MPPANENDEVLGSEETEDRPGGEQVGPDLTRCWVRRGRTSRQRRRRRASFPSSIRCTIAATATPWGGRRRGRTDYLHCNAEGRTRTCTGVAPQGILSPLRLPISPPRLTRIYAQGNDSVIRQGSCSVVSRRRRPPAADPSNRRGIHSGERIQRSGALTKRAKCATPCPTDNATTPNRESLALQ